MKSGIDNTDKNVDFILSEKNKDKQSLLGDFDKFLQPQIFKEYQKRIPFQQNWSKYNLSQQHEMPIFIEYLNNLLDSLEVREVSSLGRPRLLLRDIIFCSVFNIYTTVPTRKINSYLQNIKKDGLIKVVPSFSTIRRYLRKESLSDKLIFLIEESSKILKNYETTFAVDSTGFSSLKFNRWNVDRLQGRKHRRDFKKCHICVGVKSGIVTAIKVTRGYDADTTFFRELINTTKTNGFNILEVVADKGYHSKDNYELVNSIGALPFIPFKSNSTGKSRGSYYYAKMYREQKDNPEYFYNHYHQRSIVESVFSAIKRKFLDYTRAKSDIGRNNEIFLKILAYNICILVRCVYFRDKIFDDDKF